MRLSVIDDSDRRRQIESFLSLLGNAAHALGRLGAADEARARLEQAIDNGQRLRDELARQRLVRRTPRG